MVKVLIATKPDDADSIYVKLALEKKGHECIVWYTADFPEQQVHSFELLKNKKISWNASGVDFKIHDDQQFDVVWLRRPRKPKMPASIHEADIENATNENSAFYRTFWHVISPEAFWVNSMAAINSANCKLLQLRIAVEVGFNVPDSLFSNDPERIKMFINQHQDTGVVYKSLHPVIWINENEMRLTYTDEIKIDHLPSNPILQSAPGIFQGKINKYFELRVTYFGEQAIAVKLESQKHPRGMMDWRYIPTRELKVHQFSLPEDIDRKCRDFMKRLGLVFGCFDFIVTPDNEYYFLEINEQGQFLWIEELNSDIKMLDAFTDFLIHSSESYKCMQLNKGVSLRDLQPEMIPIQQNAIAKHINPDSF